MGLGCIFLGLRARKLALHHQARYLSWLRHSSLSSIIVYLWCTITRSFGVFSWGFGTRCTRLSPPGSLFFMASSLNIYNHVPMVHDHSIFWCIFLGLRARKLALHHQARYLSWLRHSSLGSIIDDHSIFWCIFLGFRDSLHSPFTARLVIFHGFAI
jgi:hypothetical protein